MTLTGMFIETWLIVGFFWGIAMCVEQKRRKPDTTLLWLVLLVLVVLPVNVVLLPISVIVWIVRRELK